MGSWSSCASAWYSRSIRFRILFIAHSAAGDCASQLDLHDASEKFRREFADHPAIICQVADVDVVAGENRQRVVFKRK